MLLENNNPLVSCLVLNWNRKEETDRAIDSIINQTYNNIEIVLIDNNSNDGSQEFFKDSKKIDKFLPLNKNYGCPGGRNRGIKYCDGELIFFVDNDGVLHYKAIENAVTFFNKNPETAVLTGHVVDFDDIMEVNTKMDLPELLIQDKVIFQGGISIHRKQNYKLVGLYPDDYIYGAEETYLSLRILDKNLIIRKSNHVILFHKKSTLARNIKKEKINVWANSFYNAYQTYPLFFLILYFLYFHIAYSYYSLKNKFFVDFLVKMPEIYRKFYKYPRKPVKTKTFFKFQFDK